ncbi:class I SAM-dependent methyltransferase [Roseibium sp. RKSG952]|uniref:class I SAM-dependent methyltransferase n=1 Tax=Roseibium sp. RKSG952 TaxID=2529384 RepID=UPI0012BCF763|nr:class I SAM-dependent methyltransferase [Roseibium sp. RKSG952]MTI00011.1 class I SAM-dependent methyltransferase [Roseibium sp. RKSG952]
MSSFSADWLLLREPIDLAARNASVEAAFLQALLGSGPLLDLASGAGSTVMALRDRLPAEQSWILTDHDPALIETAKSRFDGNSRAGFMQVDLAAGLDRLPFNDVSGVTTSAFLDLVTGEFLEGLVDKVTRSKRPFLASLTYDGRAWCTPEDPLDFELTAAMNAHQKTDKGFGTALGPDAAHVAARLFREAGYEVVTGTSDWNAGDDASEFLEMLCSGWVDVGVQVALDKSRLEEWHSTRACQIATGQLQMGVGHIDLAAFPA